MAKRVRVASPAEAERSRAAASVEIRVHGIGEHTAWSSLGEPRLVSDGGQQSTDVALPPRTVPHELRLLGWTRTGRRKTGPLWYLALPFSLVNMSREMNPPGDGWRVSMHRTATALAGLTLTAVATLWSLAIAETLARRAPWSMPEPWAARSVVLVVAGALLATVWLRGRITPHEVVARTSAVHSLAILAVAGWAWTQPVQRIVTEPVPAWMRPLVTPGQDADGAIRTHLDPLAIGTVAAVVAVALLALALLVAAPRGSAPDQVLARSALAGSALAITTGVWVLITVASATRLALDHVIRYLQSYLGWPLQPPTARAVLPYQGEISAPDDWLIDLVPLAALAALVVLVLALLAAVAEQLGAGIGPSMTPAAVRATRVHNLVVGLRTGLHPAMAWAIPVASVVVPLSLVLVARLGPRGFGVISLVVQVLAALVVVVLIWGRSQVAMREVLGGLADIIGFWPVRGHPLAGVSYRGPVIAGLRDELAIPRTGATVLVGHSQGSVLALWALAHGAVIGSAGGLRLVTCGSPIDSLYRTFFPAQVTDEVLQAAKDAAGRGWVNCWRSTDPIATPMPEGLAEEVPLQDPGPDGIVLGHGDYWTDKEQLAKVMEVATPVPTEAS